jgi:hypothetical protein
MYKEAEQLKADCLAKDKEIDELKKAAQTVKAPSANGNGNIGGDATYWKKRYEQLLDTFED